MYKFVILTLLLFPALAYANVVWPSLYLETRLFSWWAISVGLVIEYLFVRRLLICPPGRALIVTFFANLVSAVFGIILVPLSGIIWEVFPGLIMNRLSGVGTFNPVTWAASFVLACGVNVLVEGAVYKKVFNLEFVFRSRVFLWFMLANSASVGVAMISLVLKPVLL